MNRNSKTTGEKQTKQKPCVEIYLFKEKSKNEDQNPTFLFRKTFIDQVNLLGGNDLY